MESLNTESYGGIKIVGRGGVGAISGERPWFPALHPGAPGGLGDQLFISSASCSF